MTFSSRLRQHAHMQPGKPAIVEPGRSINFRQLDRMVDRSCYALRAKGIEFGQLIGLSLQDRAEYLIVLLAMGRIGAVVLPLDPRWAPVETLRVCASFGATQILCDSAQLPVEPGDGRWTVLEDADFGESEAQYDEARVDLATPMLVSLSSGTTGIPKGPRVTQGQFVHRFAVFWSDLGLSAHDRFLSATPLYFGGGRAFALAMIYEGGTALLLCPPHHPEAMLEFANAQQATATFLVPTQIRRLLGIANNDGVLLPTMRALISSGAELFAAEHREVRRKLTPNLYQYYSSTEGGGCTVLPPQEFEVRPDSVGRPCHGVEVEVVDAEHRPLPPRHSGLVRYRSAASADHYYRGDESEAFRDGFFYPGDLGEFDAEGYLYLRGRSKDVIIRGGVNVYPSDIESIVLQFPGVSDAAVVGVLSQEFGEDIAVAVVTRGVLDVEALRIHCTTQLAPYKQPTFVLQFDELPKSGIGKISKPALKAMVATRLSARHWGSCKDGTR